MTENAVIDGVYADFKFVKTRGVAQVVVEIPLERAATFVEMFGVPNPSEETWVAVARMRAQPRPEKPKERQRWEDMRPSNASALACQNEDFQQFCSDLANREMEVMGKDLPEDAAEFVRDFCRVNSRSSIDAEGHAQDRWKMLLAEFRTWQTEQRYGDMAR